MLFSHPKVSGMLHCYASFTHQNDSLHSCAVFASGTPLPLYYSEHHTKKKHMLGMAHPVPPVLYCTVPYRRARFFAAVKNKPRQRINAHHGLLVRLLGCERNPWQESRFFRQKRQPDTYPASTVPIYARRGGGRGEGRIGTGGVNYQTP